MIARGSPTREGWDGFRPVIGLEVHVRLSTATKLFCADPAEAGARPNTRVCPVCMGLPGALPALNRRAVELAVRAAAALNCDVHEVSRFARKQYFYPDLPKGYQITQHDRPLASRGWLDLPGAEASRIGIRQLHLEEDAGRLLHHEVAGRTAIDLNRAGVALMEIVTEPELGSGSQARAFLLELKRLLQYVGVSECDMENGSLRVDANVSVSRGNAVADRARTELKNLNSFGNVERAVRVEAQRQAALLARGGEVTPQTLLWDADAGRVRPMRAKEAAHDYRYFPDPDLPPLVLPAEWVDRARASQPELPAARERRLQAEYGLPAYDAGVLTASRDLADYFEAVARASGDGKAASNWVMTGVLAWLKRHRAAVSDYPVQPEMLARIIRMAGRGLVSMATARRLLDRVAATGEDPEAVVDAEGLSLSTDDEQIRGWVHDVLRAHPAEARRARDGEGRVVPFLMGQVMRRSDGRAEPARTAELLREALRSTD
jgi:aspartyl-tRNA(Asn)/glutamyl-tRNA(Gln) amidotransferase subunit B